MAAEQFDLDRQTKVNENIDALGKKWEIKQTRGNGLYFTRPNPDRPDAVIPTKMQGHWTKPSLLQTQIDLYLDATFDQAEKAQAKAERIRVAAEEAAALKKKAEIEAKKASKKVTKKTAPKAKNDTGSKDTKESAAA